MDQSLASIGDFSFLVITITVSRRAIIQLSFLVCQPCVVLAFYLSRPILERPLRRDVRSTPFYWHTMAIESAAVIFRHAQVSKYVDAAGLVVRVLV